jgi:hypothetical protein
MIRKKIYRWLRLDEASPAVRRIVVGLIGVTVVVIGIVLIFLPGPAFVVIPAGLLILAGEFAWARRGLQKLQGIRRRIHAGAD